MKAVKSPVIRRPKDKEAVARLRDKLAEYEVRLASASRRHPRHRHPDFKTPEELDAIFKSKILDQVLNRGRVSGWNLSLRLAKEFRGTFEATPEAFGEIYNNAFAVITGYCTDGGRTVRGGTGLSR